MAEPDMSQMTL